MPVVPCGRRRTVVALVLFSSVLAASRAQAQPVPPEQPGVPTSNDTARLSRDGRFVIFGGPAPLVANDVNGQSDGYLYDRDIDGNGVFDEPGKAGLSLVTTGSGNALGIEGSSGVLDV